MAKTAPSGGRILRLASHPQIRRMLRCASVSATTTLLSLAVLGSLALTRLIPAGWANVVATVAGIGPSYWLNRRWVWGRSGGHNLGREVLPFWVMSLTALALSTLAVSSAARFADHAQLSAAMRTAVVLATNVTVFASLWIVQFLLLDRVLFRPRSRQSPTRAPHASVRARWSAAPAPSSARSAQG